MEQWLDYLMSNPTAMLIAGVIAVLLIFFLLKRLIKLAIILFIIFVIVAAINYKTYEPKEIMDKIKKDARELKQKSDKKVRDKINQYKDQVVKDVEEKVKAPLSK